MNEDLIPRLHALGAVQFGQFTLKSGAISPVYLDLRLLISDPPLLADVAQAYAGALSRLTFDRLAAIPLAGLPIGTAVSLATGRPMIFPRLEAKTYGTGRTVEGRFVAGETAVVIDDVISSGASKREAIDPLVAAGLVVRDVVVLVDRQSGGADDLAAAGYHLHAIFTLGEIADTLATLGRLDSAQHAAVRAFIGGDV